MLADGPARSLVGVLELDHRLGERAAMGVEPLGEVAQVPEHLLGDAVERADVLVHARGCGAGALEQIVHGGHELVHPHRQDLLDRGEVALGAAQDIGQQAIGVAQPLEQRSRVGPQHAVGFHHLGDSRGGLLGLVDRGRGRRLQVGESALDCSPSACPAA